MLSSRTKSIYIVNPCALTFSGPVSFPCGPKVPTYVVKSCTFRFSGPVYFHCGPRLPTYIVKSCTLKSSGLVCFHCRPRVPPLSNPVRLHCRALCVFIADQEYLPKLSNPVRLDCQALCAFIADQEYIYYQILCAYIVGPVCFYCGPRAPTYIVKSCAFRSSGSVCFNRRPRVPTLSNPVRLHRRALCVFIADQKYLHH